MYRRINLQNKVLSNILNKKIIGWAVSGVYFEYKNRLQQTIDYLVDSNPAKQNVYIDGKFVFPPKKLLEEKKEEVFIIVFSDAFYSEISETLKDFGYLEYENFCCYVDIIEDDYKKWLKKKELKTASMGKRKQLQIQPLISILVPTYETDQQMLIEMIESVLNQTYPNWELCIADGGSRKEHVKKIITEYSQRDARIKYIFLNENKGIIGNSQEAFALCHGEYVGLLDHDDLLSSDALYEVVKTINEEDPDLIYSDEDKISADSLRRFGPHFKPEWSPDTLRSYNYITHFAVFKYSLFKEIGGFRGGYEGSQDYDLILRAAQKAKKISHIPKILYHWRVHNLSATGNPGSKSYAYEAAKKAILANAQEEGPNVQVEDGLFLGGYRVRYGITDYPLISIIINDHEPNMTQKCIASIKEKSTYKNYELVIITESDEEKIWTSRFKNMRLINRNKVHENQIESFSKSEYFIFLDHNLGVKSSDWMENLLEHAQRTTVGVVGCKILNTDNSLRHVGLVMGMSPGVGFVCAGLKEEELNYRFYCKFLAQAIRNVSAVTGCVMVQKDKLIKQGINSSIVDIHENVIELCLKMLKTGLVNIYTPYAVLQALDNSRAEISLETIKMLQVKYPEYFKQDPYYNPNLDRHETTPKILS